MLNATVAEEFAESSVNPCDVEQWTELLNSRVACLSQLGARYAHLQLPSRAQLVSHPVRRLTLKHPAFIDAVPSLRRVDMTEKLLDPVADELTAEACYRVAQLLCGSLNVQLRAGLLGYPHQKSAINGGQRKRYKMARHSHVRYVNQAGQTLIDSVVAPPQNARAFFQNTARDAVRKTILVFGEPMAELSRALLGGILAETFKNVHIVANAAVDESLVARLCPDIVLTVARGEPAGSVPEDSAGVIARFEQDERVVADSSHSGALREIELLGSETYELAAPITVQGGCVNDVADTFMKTRPVKLYEAENVDVFFDGPRIHVADVNGVELMCTGVPSAEELPRSNPLVRRKRLSGTSFLLGASSGAHCYYHWMVELLPRLGMLQQHGIDISGIDHFLIREISGNWQLETLAQLGIGPDRIVETRKRPRIHCDQLFHVDHAGGINLKMHRFVPQWLKHLFPLAPAPDAPKRLYIGRPEGVRRGVINELELAPILEHHGVTRVVMEGLSVAEQARLLSGAELVIAPHGGALTNMVFCRPGTRIVELLSRHVYPYYHGLAACCGHVYYAALQDPERDYSRLVSHDIAQLHASAAQQRSTSKEGFSVDPEILASLLNRVSRR